MSNLRLLDPKEDLIFLHRVFNTVLYIHIYMVPWCTISNITPMKPTLKRRSSKWVCFSFFLFYFYIICLLRNHVPCHPCRWCRWLTIQFGQSYQKKNFVGMFTVNGLEISHFLRHFWSSSFHHFIITNLNNHLFYIYLIWSIMFRDRNFSLKFEILTFY